MMQATNFRDKQDLMDTQSYGLDFLSANKDQEQEELEKAFGYLDLQDLENER